MLAPYFLLGPAVAPPFLALESPLARSSSALRSGDSLMSRTWPP